MPEIFYVLLLTILASIVGTVAGFGTSAIMIPALILFYPIHETLLLVGIIHFCVSLWKGLLFKKCLDWKIILWFGAPGMLFSYAGAYFVTSAVNGDYLSRFMGGFLILYVVFLLLNPSFRLKQNLFSFMAGGSLTGFLAGIFGISGPVRSAFLSAFNLEKTIYVATSGILALVIDITRLATYLYKGVTLGESMLYGVVLFVAASIAGVRLGALIIEKIPQKIFRMVVVGFIFLIAVKLLMFP